MNANNPTNDEKLIKYIEALRLKCDKRSSFQHAYFISNIGICGAVMSFSLTNQHNGQISQYALLVIPLISFCFFMLWFHQAITIMERGEFIKQKWKPPDEKEYYKNKCGDRIRISAYVIGILGGFIGVPFTSFLIYCKMENPIVSMKWALVFTTFPLFLNFIAFLIWSLNQYRDIELIVIKKKDIKTEN